MAGSTSTSTTLPTRPSSDWSKGMAMTTTTTTTTTTTPNIRTSTKIKKFRDKSVPTVISPANSDDSSFPEEYNNKDRLGISPISPISVIEESPSIPIVDAEKESSGKIESSSIRRSTAGNKVIVVDDNSMDLTVEKEEIKIVGKADRSSLKRTTGKKIVMIDENKVNSSVDPIDVYDTEGKPRNRNFELPPSRRSETQNTKQTNMQVTPNSLSDTDLDGAESKNETGAMSTSNSRSNTDAQQASSVKDPINVYDVDSKETPFNNNKASSSNRDCQRSEPQTSPAVISIYDADADADKASAGKPSDGTKKSNSVLTSYASPIAVSDASAEPSSKPLSSDGESSRVISLSTKSQDTETKQVDWAIPRWKELELKRLALCQQRVNLERRLFEFQTNDIILHSNQLKRDPAKPSSSEATASCSSSSNSEETPDTKLKMRRYILKAGQEPVLWSGDVNVHGKPDGVGRMVFSDGQVYEGDVRGGRRQGQGTNKWPNGQVYTGSWHHNSRSGRGTHKWPDGRTVTGPWLDGHLHGRVFFRWPDGATYDGDTVHGQKDGKGIHTWKDGRVYTGQYKMGSEHGFGSLTERDQTTKYRGQFREGKRHGYGMQIWKNKNYDGEWMDNMIHGRGKLTWFSGACYTGEFEYGRYHGKGSYRSESGKKYIGQWFEGCKHGQGKQFWPDGQVYQGSFVKNKRHGYGRLTYPSGSVYTGGWVNGKKSGRGIEIVMITNEKTGKTKKDIRHCGLWKDNEPVYEERRRPDNDELFKSFDDLDITAIPKLLFPEQEGQIDDDFVVWDSALHETIDSEGTNLSRDADPNHAYFEC